MTGKRHAYLIMAHDNFYCLDKLIDLLSNKDCDIYLHIDKKTNIKEINKYPNITKKAKILIKRINVTWGTYSQIKTELLLFKTAYNKEGRYSYYHILSGSDLPIKNYKYIQKFFADKNTNYIKYNNELTIYDYQRIAIYRNVFTKKNNFTKYLNSKLNIIQAKLKIDRIKRNLSNKIIKRGTNWCSITEEAVKLILSKERFIKKICKYTSCADEMYKQIILLNSSLPIFNEDLRYVDWSMGGNNPLIYTNNDYTRLIESDKLFARKFHEKIDIQIIDKIYNFVKTQSDEYRYNNCL